MTDTENSNFFKFLEQRAKELAPDYPFTQNDPYEHLWAITSSLEGVSMANDDCHKIIEILRNLAGVSKEDLNEFWMKELLLKKGTK